MIWFVALLGILAIGLVAWWFQRQIQRTIARAGVMLTEQAQQVFAQARQADAHAMAMDKQKIDGAIQGLEKQLSRYEHLVKEFEKDRDQQYGKLTGAIDSVVAETKQLGQTTSGLAAVLGNSRVRGQWGQKMAEDILTACGLREGIQYVKEREIAAGRPDYTFLLPENHKLFMDVKFPLDNYLRFTQAEAAGQGRAKEQFIRDVREHLRTMERRDYVSHEDGSLDYIVIFIPNEQVYGAVNEWMPGLIDECLKKRTILCGPWTLYAILRIIWQAWQNYNYSLAIRDIIKSINGFLQDYGKFKERFTELGDRLAKVSEKYQEISATSYKRLDQRLQQIEGYRKGHQIPEETAEPEAPLPSVPALTKQESV
ncbi:MAG: DNA recombination protein RmuC [Candidatus Omnitrophota bacterium]|nr:DNA recombination protein RmuC [Candidatus Omnitrophota bacterium]